MSSYTVYKHSTVSSPYDFTYDDQARLARIVLAYWEKRGRMPVFEIVKQGADFFLRSDMRNGVPPTKRA